MPVIGECSLDTILRLRESRRAPGGARRRARTARRPIKVRLRGCGAVTLTVETHDKKRHLNNGVEPQNAAHFPARNCVSDPDRPALVDLCGPESPGLRTARSVQRANRWRQGRKAKRRGGMGALVRSLVDPIAPTATPRIKRTRAGILYKVPVLSLWHTQSGGVGREVARHVLHVHVGCTCTCAVRMCGTWLCKVVIEIYRNIYTMSSLQLMTVHAPLPPTAQT